MPLKKEAIINSVRVEIYDQSYNLRSTSDGERVSRLARLVDQRMRDIANQMSTVDSTKIAILAALNIADELEYFKEASEPPKNPRKVIRTSDLGSNAGSKESEGRSGAWDYEDIFKPLPGDRNVEKLGHQIAARLQSRRITMREDGSTDSKTEGDVK